MKGRRIAAVPILFAVIFALCACGREKTADEGVQEAGEEQYTVYASFYPIYALSALVIDDDIPGMTLHCLVQPQDGCLRDYSLSDWDLYLAADADVMIFGGRGLESFADAFLSLGADGPSVITAMYASVLLGQEDDARGEEDASHILGANPWLFLSVDGAAQIAESIAANMMILDEPYVAQYQNNVREAGARFRALKAEMEAAVEECDRSVPVALLHEGLIYLSDELRLNTVLRYDRESGVNTDYEEYEALSAALTESGARVILIERQAPDMLVNRLKADGYIVARIDTLSTGREELGADGYFTAMRDNAQSVRSALRETEE